MKNKLLMTVTIVGLLLMSVQNFAQAPTLGTAADFVLFSTVGAVGNTGISHVTGNVGTNSGAITGFGNVNGVMNTSNGATEACAADLLIAYNQLNSAIPNFFPAPLLGNGQILGEGVYAIASPATLNNELTLDAQNDPDAVFIFQINGAFSTFALSSVTLINGAQACNVFWKIEGLVDMTSGTTMRGTVIANNGAININADGVLEGRALSTSGAVNVSGVLVYTPIGCGSPVLMGPAAPDLVSAACYAIFSSDGPVSNAGITYVVGDVGTNVGLTTGFDPLLVTGMIHPIPDGSTAAAAADLLNAYNYLYALPFDIQLLYPAQFGNDLVLTPHTYLLNAATTFTGDLYLNAGGEEDAVFVIQIYGALTTSTYANVILMDGTKPENVFWKVDGAVAINDYSNFVGTIIANNGAVDLTTGVTLEGRAFTTTGALSTASVTVNMPPGCGVFTSPLIINQPEDQTVCVGESVSFTVVASGLDLTYQWRKGNEELTDGGNLSGTTSNVFTINAAGMDDAASDYNVVVSGTYLPDAISDEVSLTVQPLPENVNAGDDANTCATCPYTFSLATAENFSTLLWTSSGDGEFDDETALNPVYTPGLTDPGTTLTLCLSAYPIAPCQGLSVVDCMELEVLSVLLPSANAGDDQTICVGEFAELVGEAQNYSGVMWSTSGDGEFSALISLITNYTPGPADILAGVVSLCLTAELIIPGADPVVDCMKLTILGLPTADAGIDATVCATCPYTLLDATAENYSSLLWTTSGNGEFEFDTDLNPVYTPGLNDPGTTVVLCLSAAPISPCDVLNVENCMELEVLATLAPFANAGDNQTICENQLAELAGEAYNYSSVMWSTSGDGEFSAENSLITDYTPGTADISAGTAELCLTATLDGAVPVSDVDCITLTILGLPTADAGIDATVCATCPYTLLDATAENYSSLLWTTSGNGEFEFDTDLNPVYTPGLNDPGTTVVLCLSAAPISPCDVLNVENCMELLVVATLAPFADAGDNQTICENQLAELVGEAENYTSVMWSTIGDGEFSAPNSLITNYTPGTADISAGTAELCLTATLDGAVPVSDVDCMTLTIAQLPNVYAGDDITACSTQAIETNPTVTNYLFIKWTTSGDGYFEEEEMEITNYIPGANDLLQGQVELCLEAYSIDLQCNSVVDCLQLFLVSPPTVDAGDDFSVCEGDDAQLNGAAENYTILLWTTQGNGTFDDEASLNPVYTPGSFDLAAGSVILCLTATGSGSCDDESAINCITLSIIKSISISGLDTEMTLDCSDYDVSNHVFLPLELYPVILNASTTLWSSNGDGYFEDATSENPVYHLGSYDIWNGGFILCVEATQTICSLTEVACINIIVPIQIIPIEVPAWNGISSYVEKSSFTVPQVMAPVASQLSIMINSAGRYYWASAVPPINQLGNWLPIGYKAKFISPTCLPLYGDVIANQSFMVSGSFTFLPVLTNIPTSIENLLGANASLVLLIYDWATGTVWTTAAADLQFLTPGKAYLFVKKTASTSFNVTFPAFDPNYFIEKSATEPTSAFAVANSPWNDIANTSQPHIILFAEGSLNDLQAGDIIGAFNENGLCVGVSEFEAKENFNKLIALGDDSYTDGVDGYAEGEQMTFKLYRPNTATTSDIYFAYDPTFPSNEGMFEVNGVSSVTKITIVLTTVSDLNGLSTVQVFPNPAKDFINIVSGIAIKQIKLVNLTGQLLLDLPVNETEISVDISTLVTGLYFIQIETADDFITTKRLIIK